MRDVMAKIECKCGEIINVTNDLNEFDLIPSNWIESICQEIENVTLTERKFYESFLLVHQTVYKCSRCYRFWFENSDGTFTSYIPEHKCEEALSKSLESKVPFWKKIIMN